MLELRYVSTESLDGVIDLERLRSGPADSLERDARKFFDLTYLSEDLHKVLRGLSQRFKDGKGPGTVLAQAVKGLGKSHTLLLGYHLFASSNEAKAWVSKNGYEWAPPENAEIIVHKFTDQSMPHDALWLLIGARLNQGWSADRPPDLDDFRSALKDKHLVLILDELERGIQNIADPARRSQNLSFLQMLSEEAARDNRVTVFAAVYDGNIEPGSTLKRTQRIELHFRKPEDRASIVRHRLFKNAGNYDKDAARSLIQSYINTWRRFGMSIPDGYLSRMETSFPFLPDLIELVFERITESGGFQGTRSALGLLGAMLDATAEGSYLMSAAYCRITDAQCADRLLDLDPTGTLVNAALSNFRDLATQPYAESIASSVLLASLVPGGRAAGLSAEELVRHVVKPGDDPNQFYAGIEAFKKFGTRFHEREGRFVFDLEENEYAKVELDAIKYNDEAARDQLVLNWLQDVFRDTQQTVVFRDLEETKSALQGFSRRGQRYVIAPRRLSQEERFALYQGLELRNQVLLLEPRDTRVSYLADANLLALAKRLKAARQLAGSSTNAERRMKFEKIADEQTKQIQRTLKSGFVYVRIEGWGDQPSEAQFEEESLGQAASKDDVRNYLLSQVYPQSLFEEHLRKNLTSLFGQRVEQVDRAYRNTLGFPVPLTDGMVADALVALVADRNPALGLQHPKGNFCGEKVSLSDSELSQAVLAQPWPEGSGRSPQGALFSSQASPVTGVAVEPPTAEQDSLSEREIPASTISEISVEEMATPHCRSLGELRQQVAARLTSMEDPVIRSARFTVLADYRGQDLSGLPAAYRGALSGPGDLGLQFDITVRGPMSKATLEQHCEKVPNLSGAGYSVRFTVEVPAEGRANGGVSQP
ncbi:MAG: hypothetical protein M1461_01045 [Nitrospirae bacterium]|nr:hypothetical protein [Nitrospirota bacterium]